MKSIRFVHWNILTLLGIIIIAAGLTFSTQHTAWIEMLVYPYLLNHGFVLYRDLIAPYTPLFLWFLQFVTSFLGYTPQVSLGITLFLIILNIIIIYFISKSLWKNMGIGILSAALYLLWFSYFEGNGLWFELFQTPFILLSFYFFYLYFFRNQFMKNLFLGALFLSISFFIKQSTLWIILFIVGWILINHKRKSLYSLCIFAAPLVVLLILTTLVTGLAGYSSNYWQWAFGFAFFRFPFSPGHSDYPTFTQIVKLGIPLSVLILMLVSKGLKKEKLFQIIFLAASAMAILPRWGLFHLQPFLGLFAVVIAPSLWNWFTGKVLWKKYALVGLIVLWVVVVGRQSQRFWQKPIRFFEPEIYQISQILQAKEYKDVFIFNGPDQLYLLTGIIPKVKPYTQNFAWYLEEPGLQQQEIESIQKNKPQYIILAPFSTKAGYKIGDYRPQILGNYLENKYHLKEKLSPNLWVWERN